jgi:hypothetical protein
MALIFHYQIPLYQSLLILLADPTLSGLLAWFSSLRIKKFTESPPPNVIRSIEIRMFIMSQNRTNAWSTNFDFCHEDRYIDAFL